VSSAKYIEDMLAVGAAGSPRPPNPLSPCQVARRPLSAKSNTAWDGMSPGEQDSEGTAAPSAPPCSHPPIMCNQTSLFIQGSSALGRSGIWGSILREARTPSRVASGAFQGGVLPHESIHRLSHMCRPLLPSLPKRRPQGDLTPGERGQADERSDVRQLPTPILLIVDSFSFY
jgi:hypothetical protein